MIEPVWLDNPPVNALSGAVLEHLRSKLESLDDEVRVVVLRGRRERAFSAETDVGGFPGGGGTQRAPRPIGGGHAAWLIGSGERAPAGQAERRGLVDLLVDDLEEGIERVAGTPARQSPHAPRRIEALLGETRAEPDFGREAEAFAACLLSDDGQEGVAAFPEKREPRWTGR